MSVYIKVGVMSLSAFKKRTIAIAKGEYKLKKDEPKIWFPSMKSLAHILSEENQNLLALIANTEFESIKELEKKTGRKANNLLRTLRMLENYGFVKLVEGKKDAPGRTPLIPKALCAGVKIELVF